MQIEKAIKHFHYKLSNIWKATDKDIEAFKGIRDFVVRKNENQINNNQLFAKLYVYVYAQFLEKYNATVFDPIPQKELNKMLSKPLDLFIQSFTKNINESDMYENLQNLGLELKHPAIKSDKDIINEKAIISDLSDDKIKDVLSDTWKVEDVENNLIAMLNAALNEIR